MTTARVISDAELHRLAGELGIAVWTPSQAGRRWGDVARAARESTHGRLPPRYATDSWDVPFRPRLEVALRPGIRILDVGAGARPTLALADRPEDCAYVGFDVAADELLKAPPGSYDEIVVGDVCATRAELIGEFDLVLSWLTMEHVRPVPQALENLCRYQRPGGRFLGYLAGTFSLHALVNRVLPHRVSKQLLRRFTGRDPDTVFRAHYDRCWHGALTEVVDRAWAHGTVIPVFTGGWYFQSSPLLRAPFLAYEEWAYTGGHENLAAYYLIDAVARG